MFNTFLYGVLALIYLGYTLLTIRDLKLGFEKCTKSDVFMLALYTTGFILFTLECVRSRKIWEVL